MTPTEVETRLRSSLKELTGTTPLANPEHPRERPVLAPASEVSAGGGHIGRGPDGVGRSLSLRKTRPMRLAVGAVSAVLAVAVFGLAVAYGPGISDRGGAVTALAQAQSAARVAATVELRSGDLPGWPGFRSPAPDPATEENVARCVGRRDPLLPPPVASARSKQFVTTPRTEYAQSYTNVFATVAQAKLVMALVRQSRFPSCDATEYRASSSHLLHVAVVVGPPPQGVHESDSRTISTSYSTQQVGATRSVPIVVRAMLVRVGSVVTDVVVTAELTAGAFPDGLFHRLAVTVSRRLARAA